MSADTGEWVLLTYRLPREPSTPRIAVWRRLRRLGVAQLADGVVALPADARTREQLEWVAGQVQDAHGTAAVWV
ncbi:MAG: Chromate resistance protein ChrB, partial [Actinomycetes bacterium]